MDQLAAEASAIFLSGFSVVDRQASKFLAYRGGAVQKERFVMLNEVKHLFF
jgi:hypothetical protein